MHNIDVVWAEILVWGSVLAGLAVFAGVAARLGRFGPYRARTTGLPPTLERGYEWNLVMRRATKELARAPRVEALQASATTTIEAAEYAYNRLLLDCARHCTAPSVPDAEPPAPEPAEPVREPEKTPAEERAPLAA